MKKNYFFILLSILISNSLFSTIIKVPFNYPKIQQAINASLNGDTIEVASGTYFENINFRGKNVLLTSQYYLSQNVAFITSTIIDGSSPLFSDTASCVIFNSGENANAILQGFTITGGKGTKWFDIHGAGTFREGGGILIELSSPTIIHNLIINNNATNITGVTDAGGGGIRIGDGNPTVCSNAIMNNQAKYGPGIVLNYTGGKYTNNVIATNTGGQSYFGGSGIWAVNNLSLTPLIIENNTITNNFCTLFNGSGGILLWGTTNAFVKNNIIYGNLPPLQLKTISCTPQVMYNNIQGGYAGTGNINVNPMFGPNNYYLSSASSCIDSGDTSMAKKDIEDMGNLGFALFPSMNLLRNDMGAYGGPCASILPAFSTVTGLPKEKTEIAQASLFPNPTSSIAFLRIEMPKAQQLEIEIINCVGECVLVVYDELVNEGVKVIPMNKENLRAGTYFVKINAGQNKLQMIKLVVID